MKYGNLIRATRIRIGANQKDIAKDFISRNMLSNIETSQSNLTPKLARSLFVSLYEFAWKTNQSIDIDFDEVLGTDESTQLFMKAGDIIYDLETKLRRAPKEIEESYLTGLVDFVDVNDVQFRRIELLILIGNAFGEINLLEKQYDAYIRAIDYFRIYRLDSAYMIVKETLLDSLSLGYRLGYFKNNVRNLKYWKNLLVEIGEIPNPNIDFNIALAYRQLKNHGEALKSIQTFLNAVTEDKKLYANGLTMKSMILVAMNEDRKALEIYFRILNDYKDYLTIEGKGQVINNVLDMSLFHQELIPLDIVKRLYFEFDFVKDELSDDYNDIEKVYSTLAEVSFFFLDDKEKALHLFNKAFSYIDSNGRVDKYLSVLKAFAKCEIAKENPDLLIERIDYVGKFIRVEKDIRDYIHILLDASEVFFETNVEIFNLIYKRILDRKEG